MKMTLGVIVTIFAALIVAGLLLISATENYSERVMEEAAVKKDKEAVCSTVITKAIYVDTLRVGLTLANDSYVSGASDLLLSANVGDSVCKTGGWDE